MDAQIWRALSGLDCSVDGLERVQTADLNLMKLDLIAQEPLEVYRLAGTFSLLLDGFQGENIFQPTQNQEHVIGVRN